ncbi:MAG: 2-hydroxyacyl-CoA dehydratase family protein [Proteobacteria bacterium]|nr:2-hydroxyacyl-CoA dehydratase family protein [Pseudomonadota bacterium]
MNKITANEKKQRRFLKNIAHSAAFELEQLREIPQTSPVLNYFYDALEAVFVQNDPERILNTCSGKKQTIGIYCMVIPEELIYAAGAIPIRLCAGSFEASQSGEDFVPRDGCPLVKASMGFSVQNGLKAFDMCDVVIVPTTCDSKRKLGEELSAFKNVWMLEVPHIKDANFSRRIWVEQMYALKSQLENYVKNGWSKNKITAKKLGKAINNSARAQFEIRRLLSLRKSAAPVIWGRQAMTVINSYAYIPVTDWTDSMVRLNNELSEKALKGESVCSEKTPRILIAGSPAIFPNLKLPGLIEEMGGIVVYDESCAGDRYLYDPVGSTENTLNDQITGIASRYMAPCVCPSFAPNDDRLIMLKKMVTEYRVDGIIYHVLKGCIIYDFELNRVEKENGLPLLRIETDYNPEDVEQLRTRIEAFIEMLKSKNKAKSEK